jgi:hypothetical protein
MPRNDAAAPGHVCPGIRIHVIDIDQSPGISISPIADMDVDQTIVISALATKSSSETPKKTCLRVITLHLSSAVQSLASSMPRARRGS